MNEFDNIMITKISETSDTRNISNKKSPNKPCKLRKIIPTSYAKNREGGRTVGSGRVATIIE